MNQKTLDQLAINTLRVHSIEMVEKANSGHPGMALGAAPLIYTLYAKVMQHSPKNPTWINRDRFVLSAGHASALMYSLLHLFGYDISQADLENFRQYKSITPGHPEIVVTPGVDAGTGPLGQGVAMGVGMALAERYLASAFNKAGEEIIDHYTYVLHGDGCPQEGVAAEACSFAGMHKLGKLIMIYDRNQITIDGHIDISFTEDVGARYKAYGWQVLTVDDANDIDAFYAALKEAQTETEKPSIIIVHSHIGYGSPVQDSSKAHGAPLGKENLERTKEALAWPKELAPFETPAAVKSYVDAIAEELVSQEKAWQDKFMAWRSKYPDLARKWDIFFAEDFSFLEDDERFFEIPEKSEATRESSRKVLNLLSEHLPNLIGGSADLAGSNKSWLNNSHAFDANNADGKNIHYGIREFAMSCIMNGILLHGGLKSYCATFFTFSDYMRSGIRSSALMDLPALYVFTHDSIGVGEDGPTHQPVEHLASFRAMPNILTFRPADYLETAGAYLYAIKSQRPTILALSRQNLPQIDLAYSRRAIERGAYIVQDAENPELILLASGSEVALTLEAAGVLKEQEISVRVVSMPCMELFNEQSEEYKESILPKAVQKRIAIEAGSSLPWYRYVGPDGKIIAVDDFGMSAPAGKIFEHFGFSLESIVEKAKEIL